MDPDRSVPIYQDNARQPEFFVIGLFFVEDPAAIPRFPSSASSISEGPVPDINIETPIGRTGLEAMNRLPPDRHRLTRLRR